MPKSISVVIPAYNEEMVVAKVVDDVQRVLCEANFESEVIVVDDGSTDATAAMAESAGAAVLRHSSNRGYGSALKTGIVAAQYDLIAITDADGTYPIEQLPALILEIDRADMVIGARTSDNVHIPLLRRPVKWLLKRLANYISKSKILDLNSGMRVFWRSAALQYFDILPDQFSFTSTITIAMHCDRYAVSYIPIDYHRRTGRSKIVPWDAASFAMLIIRTAMFFKPLRVFFPLTLIFLLYGMLKGAFDYTANGFISPTAILAFMGAIQFLLIGLVADVVAVRLNRTSSAIYSGVQSTSDNMPRGPRRDGRERWIRQVPIDPEWVRGADSDL